ncbi:putative transcription factor interactor and regulator CCHC(Zn) family protein [Tanacetum coccineum]
MPGDDDTTQGGGGGSSASEASKLIYGDELYLHPNDSSITNFINIKLKGTENYNVWSCAMTLDLQTKKKIGFIDGKFLSWILGSISQDLYLGQCFSTSPFEVWVELKETYDKINRSETFNLHQQINSLKRNGTPVSDYYHNLNSLWRQFDAITKLPSCTCDAQKAFKKHSDLIKLMQFLMGLDDIYQPIRSSLLTREPLPDVKTAFSLVSREESHRGSSSSTSGTKSQENNNNQRSSNNFNNNNSVASSTEVPISANTQFTAEQMQQLLNLINSKPGKYRQTNMADSRANQHMVTSLDNLENIVDISDLNL